MNEPSISSGRREQGLDGDQSRAHNDASFSSDLGSSPLASGPIDPATLPATAEVSPGQKPKPRAFGRGKDGERLSRPGDIQVGSVPTVHTSSNGFDASSPPRMAGATGTQRDGSPFRGAASPNRLARTSSPRHLSPATSQIFERDVQESTVVASELSPAIPSHIQTEDHIPPVLEASSLALTDSHLNPDEVEIVTHNAHQPAAVTVPGAGMTDSHVSGLSSVYSLNEAANTAEHEDSSSGYGAVDPMDPRRLSFISFADVVHAEHQDAGREPSLHMMSVSSGAPSISGNRSPSPIRSPISELVAGSPPASYHGLETSPGRGAAASVLSGLGGGHGELTIETMRQTLQKTGSNDIAGGTSSQPLSAVGGDEAMPGRFPS